MMLIRRNFHNMEKQNHTRHRDECDHLNTIMNELNRINQFLSQLWKEGGKMIEEPNMVISEDAKED